MTNETDTLCSVDECNGTVFSRTLCHLHYHRAYRAKNRESINARMRRYKRTVARRALQSKDTIE